MKYLILYYLISVFFTIEIPVLFRLIFDDNTILWSFFFPIVINIVSYNYIKIYDSQVSR